METMKYPNLVSNNSMAVNNGTHVEEVDSVYWQNSGAGIPGDFKDTHMLMLDDSINNLEATINDSDPENGAGETSLDFDSYLLPQQHLSTSLAELKPLPPFAGYTANLSINGIQGHHYHAIAQRLPEEENNNNNTYNSFNDHNNIVSSSTCNVTTDSGSENGRQMYTEDFAVIKLNYSDVNRGDNNVKVVYPDCAQPVESVTIKSEMPNYDIASFEYIAAAIGSAMESADTTVPSNQISQEDDVHGSRESWMDLDAWVDGAFVDDQKNLAIVTQDGLSDFVIPTTTNQSDFKSMNQSNTSTLQSLLTHNYMPLLQSRLQNGPPMKQEIPSSTNYSTSSPPANVVSTTDNLMLTVNGRFLPNYGLVDDRNQSPDLIQNYPHTTTTTVSTKKPRSRTQKKQHTANAYQDQSLGLLGKEKPVHRCTICNRGFLNKSNIKVHLRTHTGEKPFRCDTCSKAFRQKAHLLKHQQIHKRGGRD